MASCGGVVLRPAALRYRAATARERFYAVRSPSPGSGPYEAALDAPGRARDPRGEPPAQRPALHARRSAVSRIDRRRVRGDLAFRRRPSRSLGLESAAILRHPDPISLRPGAAVPDGTGDMADACADRLRLSSDRLFSD